MVDGDFVPRAPLELLGDAEYLAANDVTARDVLLGVNNAEGPLVRAYLAGLPFVRDPRAFLLGDVFRNLTLANELRHQHGQQLLADKGRLAVLLDVLTLFYQDDAGNSTVKVGGVLALPCQGGRGACSPLSRWAGCLLSPVKVGGVLALP